MSAYPRGFLPDLRRLRPWPSLQGSLWRSPDLVRLTYGELCRLVQTRIGPQPRRVLYVGPGLGHIALELARAGHDVTGVDLDEESVTLAQRAAAKDPLRHERGALSYESAEFPHGYRDGRPFDCVLFSRVLHHIDHPTAAAARAAELLGPGGHLVCVEFAHDRLGPAGALWMARTRMELSRLGWWPEPVSGSLKEETEKIVREWRAEHEDEGLNPLRAMLDPLRARFHLHRLAWHPYLFWELAAELRALPDKEGAIASRLRDQEAVLLRQRRLRGVLFSTIGRKPSAA